MARKRVRPAPLDKVTGLGIAKCSPAVCSPENSAPLDDFQAAFVAARFGLDATRARVVAELVWGRP